ncbi:MAG: 3',5'-cyclic-nucleotide phosphodiesterase [Deltaproteobacteria bacterium]|nr:3',5'-cyclic-nucleotide phosphodiesterase [Deltaproteobacteria bacterium]
MELRVLGCHGGETVRHRTSSFLLDGCLALDAGATAGTLELDAQRRIRSVLVSHAHLDHVKDLPTLADNRCQAGGPTLEVVGTRWTIAALKKHLFNDVVWPDFSKIDCGDGPTVRYRVIEPEATAEVAGFEVRAVLVSHTIESCGFIIARRDGGSFVYSGDTGPTERLWQLVSVERDLRAMMVEVSFPTAEAALATRSGHLTPTTLRAELKKLRDHKHVPTLLYHLKPTFEDAIEKECAKIRGHDLTVLRLGDQFVL